MIEPIYAAEAIYKSFQGLYHDFKYFLLTENEYKKSNPMFLYSIKRRSAEWGVLLDSNMIELYVRMLEFGFAYYRDKKINDKLDAINKKLEPEIQTFITKDNCQIVFQNLLIFKPKQIIFSKKFDPSGNIKEEKTIINLEFKNKKDD